MSWPVQSAENELSRARRTYGWRRTRSTTPGTAGAGSAGAAGRRPAQSRGWRSRGERVAGGRGLGRDPPASPVVEDGRRRRPGRGEAHRGAGSADQPGDRLGCLLGAPAAPARASSRRRADHGREQEEGEARGRIDIADRGDVADDGQRDRDDVAERPEVEQEGARRPAAARTTWERPSRRRPSVRPAATRLGSQTGM